ncbi:MAG: hypothetical protein A2X46_05170 [Lentisphaerae bacterium GWF2_57_35]|nr:MAG: hypothetical protein A2X46_05170 [Lentisphaerae bacterium GWF2_57_35]
MKDNKFGVWLWNERYLMILLFVGVLLRILLMLFSQPLLTDDSSDYLVMADWIRQLDFTDYAAKRLPAYPFLMILAGMKLRVIWAIQSCMGLVGLLFLYDLARRMRLSPRWSFIVCVPVLIGLQFLFLETAILSETMAIFLILLIMHLLQKIVMEKNLKIPLYALSGLLIAVCILTRPLFIVLAPVLLLVLAVNEWWLVKWSWGSCSRLLAFVSPLVFLVGGWILFNSIVAGYMGLSSNMYSGLLNHCGLYAELARPEYRDLAEIYIRHREESYGAIQARGGSLTVVQASAVPEMMQARGLSHKDLIPVLAAFSTSLIFDHPSLYARGVFWAWIDYWRVPLVWYPELVVSPCIRQGIGFMWIPIKLLWLLLGLGVVMVSIVYIGCLFRVRMTSAHLYLLSMLAVLWITSLLQAMLESNSENARYAIPLQPLLPLLLAGMVVFLRKKSLRTIVQSEQTLGI